MRNIILSALIIFIASCSPSVSKIAKLAPAETYPADTYLSGVANKKALIIVAHDDDLVAMAGTISKLNTEGWEIREICLVSESRERDAKLVAATKIIMDSVDFINIPPNERRINGDTVKFPYMPVPKNALNQLFVKEKIEAILVRKINEFQPEVIFTLDNELGGYGHPEHILISQMIMDNSTSGKIKPKRIYQSVYTNSMEDKILKERLGKMMAKWGFPNSYATAVNMYNLERGMPEPTVEINIEAYSENKMKFLRSFAERERKTIGFYVPYFEEYSHQKYFSVFNREFFRVIELPE